MHAREPWTIHSDLTRDRLTAIARLILIARNNALEAHNPDVGGNNWTLGCCAFQYQCHEILQAYQRGEFEWLSVVDASMQFIFKMGAVPMRFYRGPAEEPNSRTLRQSFPELKQFTLFPPGAEAREYAHRFAVETDIDGSVMAIKYVALNEEEPEFYWDIPLSGAVVAIRPVGTQPAEGVELPPPAVYIPEDDESQAKKP